MSNSVQIDANNNITNVGYIQLNDQAAPATPAAGKLRLYKKTGSSGIFTKSSNGTETSLTPVSSSSVNATASVTTNDVWSQVGPSIDGGPGTDQSGTVSLAAGTGKTAGNVGARVAVAGRNEDGNGSNSGHVGVYEYNGTSWVQLGADVDGEAAGDQFGSSVSLNSDGTVFAAGAIRNDGAATDSGHVRVFEYNGSAWVQRGGDINGAALSSDFFGKSVSINDDGTVVVIGAEEANNNFRGRAEVYAYNGSSWVQRGSDIVGVANFDTFGDSVSINPTGDIVAIGGIGHNSARGHVRVFRWNGSSWVQLGSEIQGSSTGDNTGRSVSLNRDPGIGSGPTGTILAVGSYRAGSGGIVRVYEYNGSSWVQLGSNITAEGSGDDFGEDVSLRRDPALGAGTTGAKIAVSATFNDGNGSNSGHTRIFEFDGSSWNQVGADINGEVAGDQDKTCSLVSGTDNDLVAIGSFAHNSFQGHARMFDLSSVINPVVIPSALDGLLLTNISAVATSCDLIDIDGDTDVTTLTDCAGRVSGLASTVICSGQSANFSGTSITSATFYGRPV